MNQKTILIIAGLVVLASPAVSIADDCKYSETIEQTLELDGTDQLSVLAKAGKLTVTGKSGLDEVRIRAEVCASKEDWLEESGIETREGDTARVEVFLPDTGGSWFSWGDSYARVDLELEVPDDLELDIDDSSGSISMNGVGPSSIRDSSGSMRIEDNPVTDTHSRD